MYSFSRELWEGKYEIGLLKLMANY
uniref:Uncharacterized protein n=1 Tax=Heterorhabditis bacteriophora TaxID=37862 RepID=A0A1I7WBI0_HETBA